MPPVLKPVLNPGLKDWDCHAHKIQKRSLAKTEGKRGGLQRSSACLFQDKRKRGGLKDWDCHAHKIQKRTLPKTEGKRGGLPQWDCHVASLLAKTEGRRGDSSRSLH